MKQSSMHLTRLCSAPPDVVYDFLADLGTHMTWGGNQQTSDFRLLSLEAPAGSASAGTTFTKTVVAFSINNAFFIQHSKIPPPCSYIFSSF